MPVYAREFRDGGKFGGGEGGGLSSIKNNGWRDYGRASALALALASGAGSFGRNSASVLAEIDLIRTLFDCRAPMTP